MKAKSVMIAAIWDFAFLGFRIGVGEFSALGVILMVALTIIGTTLVAEVLFFNQED